MQPQDTELPCPGLPFPASSTLVTSMVTAFSLAKPISVGGYHRHGVGARRDPGSAAHRVLVVGRILKAQHAAGLVNLKVLIVAASCFKDQVTAPASSGSTAVKTAARPVPFSAYSASAAR